MSTYLNHARHNKKACEHLDEIGEFPDWVVTTAFYCAMHYAHAIIFPFEENGITYYNIEEYFNKNKRGNDTKHSVTLALIHKKHFPIAEKYKQLKDTANTARYHDYDLAKQVVAKMRKNLTKIAEYCEQVYATTKGVPSATAPSIPPTA